MASQVYNAPLKRTRALQAAPPIHLIRQALYDSESLMPTYHSHNPADRALQMTANYERLILGLAVSPRGQRAQMRMVQPQSGSRSARGPASSLPSLKPPRPGNAWDGTDFTAVALSRVVARLDAMAAGGAPLSEEQLARLKMLSRLEGSLLAATEGEDPEAVVTASHRLLAWLDTPASESQWKEEAIHQAVEEMKQAYNTEEEGRLGAPVETGVRSRVSTPDGAAMHPAAFMNTQPEADTLAPASSPEGSARLPAEAGTTAQAFAPERGAHPPLEADAVPAASPAAPEQGISWAAGSVTPSSPPKGDASPGVPGDLQAANSSSRLRPPPPGRLPSRLTKPNRPMNVKLLREDLQRRLRKHWTRVMDLFVQWDVNGDGYISQVEFIKGLLALGIPAEPQSVGMLFSELERGPGGQVSFTELNRAIRAPDVSEAEKRRRAGGPVTVVVPLTRESYAASKAEKAEKAERAAQEAREAREAGGEHAAGPLDAEVVGVPGGPRGVTIGSPTGAGNKRTVWEVMEGKLTPDGAAGAPAWQKEVMRKAKLQVEKRKLDERRSLTSAQMVAFWGTPRIAPEVPRRRDASIAGLEKRREAARQFAAQSGLPPPDPSGGPSGISFEVEGQPPADSEPTQDHRAWLKEQAEKFIAESAEAETRRAAYAAATAALTAEAAQLDTALDVARARARAAEPAARKAVLVRAQEGQRIQREKKERELQLLQRRANDMLLATEKLVDVIDCIRTVRARHVQALRAMAEKERQLDADGGALLSSAHYALEEHERCKAKHGRLRYEADATAKAQLRDGAALRETIDALDAAGESLEAKLAELDLQERQRDLAAQRAAREAADSRGRRLGALAACKEAWALEFGRIADKTGIWLGDAERDAVEQVIAFYTEREEMNTSLFRMTNSTLAAQIEDAHRDLATLAREEKVLQAARANRAARDASGDNPAARRALAAVNTAELETLSATVQRGLAEIMPLLDSLCAAAGLELNGDLAGQRCSMSNIDEFLIQIEARLLTLRIKAHVLSRRPENEGERSDRRAAAVPASQAVLGGWTVPVTLSRAPVLNGSTVKPKGVDEF